MSSIKRLIASAFFPRPGTSQCRRHGILPFVAGAELLTARFLQAAPAARARCHRTICMVETTAQTEAVILGERGIIQVAKQGDIVLCMSTIDPLAARRFSEQLAQKGVAMLDAPVSGATHGRRPYPSVIVGGPAEISAASEDLFRAMGKKVFHVGDLGHGLAMKLINKHARPDRHGRDRRSAGLRQEGRARPEQDF